MFIKDRDNVVEVTVKGRDVNYLKTQIKKWIESRWLKVKTSVFNDVVFLRNNRTHFF